MSETPTPTGDGGVPELRYVVAPLTHVDVRDPSSNGDNTWSMSGYAAVFNQSTTLYDGKFLRISESIAPSFFDNILRNQNMSQPEGVVHFNFGHDMNTSVAATDVPTGQPGSLQLKADAHGLHFYAKVPRDDPDGVRLAAKMRSGVVKQASFAFTVAEHQIEFTEGGEDGPDTEHRTLISGKHLYDVCACGQGAYSQTVSSLRSYAAALGHPDMGAVTVTHVGAGASSRPSGGDADTVNDPELAMARSKLAASLERGRLALDARFKPRETLK